MADIKGIELASDIYGLEDETARDSTETNTSAIGTLANLETTAKNNLVAAINEVNGKIPIPTFLTNPTMGPAFSAGNFNVVKYGNLVQVNIHSASLVQQSIDDVIALTGLPKPKYSVLVPLYIYNSQDSQLAYVTSDGELRTSGGSVKSGVVFDSFSYISME